MRERVEIVRRAGFASNGDLGPDDARFLELVGAGRRVLYLGLPTAPLARALQGRACDLVLVHTGDAEAVRDISASCERVIGRPIGAAGLIAELEREQFDVVVLQGIAATVETLAELLPAVEHALSHSGALLARPEPRLEAVAAVETAIERAGLVAVRVDDGRARPAEAMTDDLLAAAAHSLEPLALVAAFRCPQDGHGLINRRLQVLQHQVNAAMEVRAGLERHIEALQEAVRMLEQERDIAQVDAANLRHTNKRLADRDEQLRELLLDAHEQLLQRDEELAAALAKETSGFGQLRYREVIGRVRSLVEELVPADAVLAVASKGDDELLDLGGRAAWHLPQTAAGVYLGHHPAGGQEAIDQLEWLRDRGAQFFVLPGSVWWWLKDYVELRDHLERHYTSLVREEGTCLIVDLRAPRGESESPEGQLERAAFERGALVQRVRTLVRDVVPEDATVAVVSHGDDELLRLDRRSGRHLPQVEGGVYAGYHPADSVTAIAQLEALREDGAEYLVIPAPQLWWLDHYDEFARHLAGRYRLVARRPEAGVVYDLSRRSRLPSWPNRAR